MINSKARTPKITVHRDGICSDYIANNLESLINSKQSAGYVFSVHFLFQQKKPCLSPQAIDMYLTNFLRSHINCLAIFLFEVKQMLFVD